jgi:cytochrome b561
MGFSTKLYFQGILMPIYQQYRARRFVYGTLFRVLHWAVAASFIIVVALIIAPYLIDAPGVYSKVIGYHRSFGILVLLLTLIRLGWRFFSNHAPYEGHSPIIKAVSTIAHATLYLLMLALPLLGWLEASAQHRPVAIFGMPLPLLIERNLDLADTLINWHTQLGWLFCSIVAIHIGSALWHHLHCKDGVLYAMIPTPLLRRPLTGPNRLVQNNHSIINKETLRLQEELTAKLGAKVSIKHNTNGAGKLIIVYPSLEKLDGILGQIK